MANAIVNFFKHVGGTLGLGGVGAIANAARSAYNYEPEEDDKLGATPVAGRLGAAASGALVGGATGLALQGGDYVLRGIGRNMMTPQGLKAYDAVNPNRPKTLFGALRQGFQTVAGGDVTDFDGYTDSVMDTVAATPTMAVQRQRQAKASLKGINEALPAIDKGLDTASEVGAQARATQQQLENKWTTTPATPATLPKVVRQSEAAKMAAEGQALETEINAIDANLANAPTLTADQMKTQRTQAKRLMGRRSQLAKSVGLKNDAHDADIQKLLTDPKEQAEIGTITASLNSNQAHLTDRTEQLKKRRYELAEKENKHASAVTAGAKELSDTDYDARLKELEDLKRRADPKNPENFEGATNTNPFASLSPDKARSEIDRLNEQLEGAPARKANTAPGVKMNTPSTRAKAAPRAPGTPPPLPYQAPPKYGANGPNAQSVRFENGKYVAGPRPPEPTPPTSPPPPMRPAPPEPRPVGKGADQFVEDSNEYRAASVQQEAAKERISELQGGKKKLLEKEAKVKPVAENKEVGALRRQFSQTDKNAIVDPGAMDLGGAAMQDIGRIGAGAAGMAAGAPIYFGRYAAHTYKEDVLKPFEERNTETPTVDQRLKELAPKKTAKGNLPTRQTAAERNERQVLEQYKRDQSIPMPFGLPSIPTGAGSHRVNRSYEFDPNKPGIHTVTPAAKPAKPGQPAAAPAAPAGVPIRPAMNTGFMSDNALMFGLGGAGAAAGFIGAATKASAYGAPADHPINVLSGATKQNISAEAQMQADQSNRVRMTNPSMIGLNDADELYFQNPSLKPTRSRSRPGQYNDDGNLTLALSALRRG